MIKKRMHMVCLPALVLFLLFSAAVSYGQTAKKTERAEIPLTNPAKPALVKVSLIFGSITVTGYNGKTVMVEAALKNNDKDKDEEPNEKAKGMYKIRNRNTGLTIMEENNVVTVTTPAHLSVVDVSVKVPYKTSLNLKSVNGGTIKVANVEGEVEAQNTNGGLELTGVKGSVLANTTNGDVKVVFDKIDLTKPMSFTTFNGDVDVTFPADAKFNVKMNTDMGEIYSDFKLDVKASPSQSAKKTKKKDGKYKVSFNKEIHASLNGGGPALTLKTYRGNIYIRKKK